MSLQNDHLRQTMLTLVDIGYRSYIFLSSFLLFDYGIVPTVCYFVFFVLLLGKTFKTFLIFQSICFEGICHNMNNVIRETGCKSRVYFTFRGSIPMLVNYNFSGVILRHVVNALALTLFIRYILYWILQVLNIVIIFKTWDVSLMHG